MDRFDADSGGRVRRRAVPAEGAAELISAESVGGATGDLVRAGRLVSPMGFVNKVAPLD